MPNPTNTDIYREVKNMKRENNEMLAMIKDHETRIRPLENWKIAYEAAVKALEGVSPSRPLTTLNRDFVNIVIRFITLLTAMVGLTYLIVSNFTK